MCYTVDNAVACIYVYFDVRGRVKTPVLFTQITLAEFTQHHASLIFLVNSMDDERKVCLADLLYFVVDLV